MKAMIFAAGLGTRLRPLTDKMPKALVPLAGKPLLLWQIEQLKAAGVTDITVNVHHFPDMITSYLRSNDNFGCRISISDEREELLETGGGLKKAFADMQEQEAVLACNADILSNIDLQGLIKAYEETGLSQLVVSDRQTQRYLCFDADNTLCGWVNTKTGEQKGQDGRRLAFSGMQILNNAVMQRLQETDDRIFSLTNFYLQTAADRKSREELKAYIPSNYRMMDVGKAEHLQEAEDFAALLAKDYTRICRA